MFDALQNKLYVSVATGPRHPTPGQQKIIEDSELDFSRWVSLG